MTIENENKIVGGTEYYINDKDKSGRITWMFFHPNYAGHGLGKQAVEHCLTILKSNATIVNPKPSKFISIWKNENGNWKMGKSLAYINECY